MPLILNIETATRNCSVSVSCDGKVIALHEVAETGYSHAEKLHVFIQQSLTDAGISYSDLDAVAVSKGPGSYTGLRIGVSAAKGLCYSLKIPLISVETLALLAHAAPADEGLVIPMIDARRMEVYSAVYDHNQNLVRSVQAEILTDASFSEFEGPIHLIGDCLEKAATVLVGQKFIFHQHIEFPSARDMAALSESAFIGGSFEDVAYFEPFYLKDFITTKPK